MKSSRIVDSVLELRDLLSVGASRNKNGRDLLARIDQFLSCFEREGAGMDLSSDEWRDVVLESMKSALEDFRLNKEGRWFELFGYSSKEEADLLRNSKHEFVQMMKEASGKLSDFGFERRAASHVKYFLKVVEMIFLKGTFAAKVESILPKGAYFGGFVNGNSELELRFMYSSAGPFEEGMVFLRVRIFLGDTLQVLMESVDPKGIPNWNSESDHKKFVSEIEKMVAFNISKIGI